MRTPQRVEVSADIGRFRPRGECTLVEAVDLIGSAIAYCRGRRVDKLLIDVTGLVGVSIPSLVDRFLMVEEWASKANGMVAVSMVVHPEYIHPKKFGVKVAADLGLLADVHTTEEDAVKWLSSVSLDP